MDVTERSAEQIQGDIEQARSSLAQTVDEIAARTSPKRLVNDAKHNLVAKAQSPAGKAVIGAVAAVVVLLLVRRIRRRFGDDDS